MGTINNTWSQETGRKEMQRKEGTVVNGHAVVGILVLMTEMQMTVRSQQGVSAGKTPGVEAS